MHKGVIYALLAAALFGASTPFAKALIGQAAPVMLAGLLYLGSGLGLLIWYTLRALAARGQQPTNARLTRQDLPWLGGAILTGGIAGPVLLMFGLTLTPA
ncbi:MAG TPA: EamA family transporter, partial [Thiobacillus sp.]|nr:EamA family transporter [Thiobacillus sp.]